MDLWQLTIFCKVVEQRSFSRAGRMIRLSQPTVSSHIKDLENHFGCRLIDRMGREAVPTREGELLYQYALRLLSLRDEAESAVSRFQDTISGRIILGGSTIPGGYLLPRLISGFLQRYPEVYPALRVADTGAILNDVLVGEVELAVVGAATTDARIVQEVLVADEMKLIVPGDHPWAHRSRVSLSELVAERFIIRESGSGTWRSIRESLKKQGVRVETLSIICELGSTEAVVQGVKNRIGLSIVSPIAVAEELEAGTLKALRIEGLKLTRHFYLAAHRHRSLSPAAQAFRRFLTETLAGSERDTSVKTRI